MKIQDLIKDLIKHSLKCFEYDKCFKEEISLDFPTDPRFGDLSSNIALKLSKLIKKPPQIAANTIISNIEEELKNNPAKEYIKEIKVEGAGFINFYLNDKYFYERLRQLIIEGKKYLREDKGAGKRVIVEFVSANPTGSLSVAHARQAAVGDSLANILNFMGFDAKKEYYLNDEGNQINILGSSVELRLKELNGEKIEFPENYYQGDYIYDIARKIQSENEKPKDLGDYAADYILGIIKKELDCFGVKFDYWYSQKELRVSGKIDAALGYLKEKKLSYEQDGALWFKSTDFGDDKDRVMIKSDGNYTYLAPDVAYHEEKYRRGFDWAINLWGPDHHGYINRLKAAVQAFGHPANSLSIIIVQLATIFRDGKTVEMSTRKGQYITLQEVLDEVGKDASRFFFLMRRTQSHLDFDLDAAKKQTPENPVYYIQYAHARISSILESCPLNFDIEAELSLLKENEELLLIKKVLQFSYTLMICIDTLDPYMLTVYLQELAETFHKFYDRHRVLGQSGPLTLARLSLIEATRITLSAGLELLGVFAPEKM